MKSTAVKLPVQATPKVINEARKVLQFPVRQTLRRAA